MTVPLYNGAPLTPGESGALPTVTILGFLQVFIKGVRPGSQGTVDAYVLNVAGCGTPGGGGGGGAGGSGVIGGGGYTPFPVRLIRP